MPSPGLAAHGEEVKREEEETDSSQVPSTEGRQDKEDDLCKQISAATKEYMSQGRLARRLKDQLKELRLGSAESDMVISFS